MTWEITEFYLYFLEDFDVEKVLLGELWSFDKYLVALKRVQRHTDVKGLDSTMRVSRCRFTIFL